MGYGLEWPTDGPLLQGSGHRCYFCDNPSCDCFDHEVGEDENGEGEEDDEVQKQIFKFVFTDQSAGFDVKAIERLDFDGLNSIIHSYHDHGEDDHGDEDEDENGDKNGEGDKNKI